METVKCALCSSSIREVILETKDSRYKTSQNKFRLVKCTRCGLVYLNPRPSGDELNRFYPDDYYSQSSRLKDSAEKWFTKLSNFKKRRLVSHYKERGRILDIGCGTGEFLHSLDPKKWDRYGVEPNPIGHKIASEKGDVNVERKKLLDCEFPAAYFDVVTMWHVLEHIPEQNETFEEIKRILKPDGILVLSSPNIDSFGFRVVGKFWLHLDLPRHLYHFTPKTAGALLEKNGFRVIELDYPVLDFPLDLYHSLKNKWASDGLKLREIIYLLPCLKLFPGWRGSMEILAQKSEKETI